MGVTALLANLSRVRPLEEHGAVGGREMERKARKILFIIISILLALVCLLFFLVFVGLGGFAVYCLLCMCVAKDSYSQHCL